MPPKQHTFFDSFFFVLLIICFILSSIDWFIGKNGRKRILENVQGWWVLIDDLSYIGIFKRELRIVANFLERIFGIKMFSKRRLTTLPLICCLITFVGSTIYYVHLYKLDCGECSSSEAWLSFFDHSEDGEMLSGQAHFKVLMYFLPLNALQSWLLLSVSLWLFNKIDLVKTILGLVLIILLNVIFAAITVFLTYKTGV